MLAWRVVAKGLSRDLEGHGSKWYERAIIILLNGTSSSGKSTIADAIQQLAVEQYLHSGIDHFLHRMPRRIFDDATFCRMQCDRAGRLVGVFLEPREREFFYAVYRAAREIARAGVNVILGDVLYDRDVVRYAPKTLAKMRSNESDSVAIACWAGRVGFTKAPIGTCSMTSRSTRRV